MSKFKVGDSVRCIDAGWPYASSLTVDKVYTVKEAESGNCIRVVADNGRTEGPYAKRFELVQPTGSYTVHHDGYQVGDPHLTINDATNWIQDNGVGGLVYTILETIARRKFEVVEKVQRELKAL
jgi:hypothetical protein